MAIYLGRWGWGLGLAGVLVGGEANFLGSQTLAQITPDSTLGTESSVVTPNVNVRGFPAERIDGGAVRGANLFHSFQEFNVGDEQRVYFANPTGIDNILSRVTGNNLSNILGTLGVDGGANLFLLNPNGIIFGSNAQLDIAGSFVASTANRVVFDNGFEFNAKNPTAPPLLTVNVPLGVQYGTNQPRTTITNTGNLAAGENLTLDAGNLDLQGQLQSGNNLTLQAQDTVKIRDSVTNPFIAAAGGQLLIQGNQIVDIFALNHPNSGLYSDGDMVLRSTNPVMGDAHYWGGGNFRIEQLAGSLGNLVSPSDPIIRASGDVSFTNYTGASLHILAGGSVSINNVTITGGDITGNAIVEDVTLSNGTPLSIRGTTQPTLDVRAGTTAFNPIGNIGGPLPAGLTTTATPTSANITIGNIDVTAPNSLVFLTNQYQPNTTLPGGNIQVTTIDTRSNAGNGGNVFIDSRGNITLPGNGFINTSSSASNAGNVTLIANGSFSSTGGDIGSTISSRVGAKGGDINIQAESLFLSNAAVLENSVSSGGIGNAGNVNINVRNSVTLTQTNYGANPTLIESKVASGAVGNGGNINIRAGSLLIEGTAALQTYTDSNGRGNAGNVFVQVDDSVSFIDGGLIYSAVSTGGQGNAGTIQIFAPNSVTMSGVNPSRGGNGGISSGLFANTWAGTSGQAGSINVNTGVLSVQNGAVVDASTANASDGGSVTIGANRLELTGGGQILSVTRGSGNAGSVNLNIADTITISGSDPSFESRLRRFGRDVVTNEADASGIYAGGTIFGSTGNGGNLSINARQLNVSNKGEVSTSVGGTGRAGDISIATTDSVNVSSEGKIITLSTQGNGGNLSISTGQLNVSDELSVIATVSGKENAGDLSIIATDSVNVVNGGGITTFVGKSSTGNSGTLFIRTRELNVRDRGEITTASEGTGDSGKISVIATDSVNVVNQSGISTSSSGTGLAGALDITTGKLSIRDGSLVFTSPLGSGAGGDLSVRATDSIEVVNGSALSTSTNGSGDAGNVIINTQNLLVDSNSKLSADTFSSGQGGDMTINTARLSVRNGGEVSTGVYLNSSGNGGKLTVNATDSVDLNGGSLATLTVGSGAAGEMDINTRRLTAQNGGRVEARTAGLSPGGTIKVNASESIELIGQGAAISSFSDRSSFGGAPSGNVNLTSGELIIRDGAEVTTATLGRGKGGDIRVQANSLSLSNNGSITSQSTGEVNAGNAGDINLTLQGNLRSNGGIISATSFRAGGGDIKFQADDIRLRDGSLISTSVFDSTGGGGNIAIDSTVFLAIEDSDILANAEAGPGGDITINSSAFLADLFSSGAAVPVGRNPGDLGRFRGNGRNDISVSAGFRGNDRVDISADSRTGTNGTVTIRGSFSERRVNPLPSWVDAEDLIDRRCTPHNSARKSSFTMTGRGGLPPSPNDPLTNQEVLVDWITLTGRQANGNGEATRTQPTHSHPQQLVEAQGWVMNSDGQVILTASVPTVTPGSSGLAFPSCDDNETATD
ncbi:filamentous hemagglutinin N-terminal domain-containing protein [Microcoleus sp. FACHB-53]|nr:filamentous hemagglutinin N-terminal domain-containing protein [Microcoleus sp. FACHB-53]